MKRTGTAWEAYDSESGKGRGKRDSYWSAALSVLIMNEMFDWCVCW